MKLIIAVLVALVFAPGAWGQSTVRPTAIIVTSCGTAPSSAYTNGSEQKVVQDVNGNLCVNASVTASASITGFPGASPTTGTPINVTTGGVTGTLPAGTVVVASNPGATNIAYCKLGASATTADQPISPGGGWFAFTVGAATQLTCITSTSTTTVNMVGGSGLPTGTGGGGGGASGGGAATIADGADVTQGAKADAKSTATDTTPITIMSVLKQISASIQAAASSLAGTLTVATHAVTQSGTWTMQPGNTPNTTPWLASVSAGGNTQAVKAASTAPVATDPAAVVSISPNSLTLTGAAVPAAANYLGNNVGGNLTGQIGCGSSVVYDASTNGATQLVALASSQKVYVCGYTIFAAGTVNVELDYGTGTACATGNNKMTPAFQLTAQTGISDQSPIWRGMATIASNELCIKTSAGVAVQAVVYYTQF